MRRRQGTGTIERRGDRFLARLPDTGRTSLGFYPSHADATTVLDAAVHLQTTGHVSTSTSVLEYGRKVIDRRERDGYRDTRNERTAWKAYVETWACAAWPLRSVSRREVLAWLRPIRAKGAHQTSQNALNLMRMVFRAALDDGLIESNPCAEIQLRKHGTTETAGRSLTLGELDALFWSADAEGKALIAFAAGTGLRQGEFRALLTADVHLDGAAPYVTVRFGSPKRPTKAGKVRRVPLFGIALEAARWWLSRAGVVFFPTVRGYHRPKSRIVDAGDWKAWLTAAGIGRLRWHDLRHTCATLLLRGDLSDHAWSTDAVRDMLGHSTVRVTERYAKPDGALAEAASRRQRQANAEPTAGGAEIAKAMEILGRCGWDLNPRVPVLQTESLGNGYAALPTQVGLAVSLLRAIASRSPSAWRRATELAEAVLDARARERCTA